jgi:hypothetical protein
MTWQALVEIITAESGADTASRIVARAKLELEGVRLTVCARSPLTREQVEAAAPGRPREAARILGVHPETVYRLIRRRPLVR